MESLGLWLPSLVLGTEEERFQIISIIIQLVVFVLFIVSLIRVIRIYLDSLELKKEPDVNQEEIEENMEKMKRAIRLLLKVGTIVFVLAIASQVISSLMYK